MPRETARGRSALETKRLEKACADCENWIAFVNPRSPQLSAPSSENWCSREAPPHKTRCHTTEISTGGPRFFGRMGASNFSSDFPSDFSSDFSSDLSSDFYPVSSSNCPSDGQTGVIQFSIRFFIRFLCLAFISKIINEIEANKIGLKIG